MSIVKAPEQTDIRLEQFFTELWRRFNTGILVVGNSKITHDGGNAGVGRVTDTTVNSASTVTLTVGSDDQVQRYDVQAGGGAYTYNIDLLDDDAYEGSCFYLYFNKAASANPTVNVRNGSGGSNIITINSASAEEYGTMFIYDGADWVKHYAVISDV